MDDYAGYTYKDDTSKEKRVEKIVALFLLVFFLVIGFVGYFLSDSRLLSKFSSGDPETRMEAVRKAIEKGTPMAARLVSLMEDSTMDEETRRLAIYALGEMKYAPAMEKLIPMLNDGPESLSAEAALALGKMGDETILPALIKVYRHAPPSVKVQAILAMGEIGSLHALDTLTSAAEGDNEGLRVAAEKALARLREKGKL